MSETAKRKTSPWFVVAVVVLLAAVLVEAVLITRPRRPAAAEKAIKESAGSTVQTFGQETAPIKIEFYAPLELAWHKKTIGLLREYDKRNPGRIWVKLLPMGNSACDAEMEKRGYKCAVIFINGKHEFTLPDGKQVDLQKQPNADFSFYNSEDVIAVLENWKD